MQKSLSATNIGRAPAFDPGLEALQKLSESTTGGRVFTVSRTMSLREIFAEISQDLRLQYELGYKPRPDTHPNSYYKLELKPKDKKLTVQARKGFFEPP
jgi:VWFA-related protein